LYLQSSEKVGFQLVVLNHTENSALLLNPYYLNVSLFQQL